MVPRNKTFTQHTEKNYQNKCIIAAKTVVVSCKQNITGYIYYP